MKRLMISWWTLALVLGGCGPSPTPTDGGGDVDASVDAGVEVTTCEQQADCDDGLFCNGAERCAPGDAAADAAGCVAGDAPCASGQECDEDEGMCATACLDEDGDGVDTCSGDCDDSDATVYPSSIEVCGYDDPTDEDCDPRTFGFLDADNDGEADVRCFNLDPQTGARMGGTDCNDNNSTINSAALEVCDGVLDEDCDDVVDEGCVCTPEGSERACGPSTDLGACNIGTETCTAAGWGTCRDAVSATTEVCEGSVDEDCDGSTDEGCSCLDGTMEDCGLLARCGTQSCSGGTFGACMGGVAPGPETCDAAGADEDCDGLADSADSDNLGGACGTDVGECSMGVVVSCSAGVETCGGAGYQGEQPETCDHLDEDCDGNRDDGVSQSACMRTHTIADGEFRCYPGGSVCPSAGGAVTTGPDQAPVARYSLWSGDIGRRSTVRSSFILDSQASGGGFPVATGGVSLILSERADVTGEAGTGGFSTFAGYPSLGADETAIALGMLANGTAIYLRWWNGASWVEVASGSMPGACSPLTSATFYSFELSHDGPAFTGTISAGSCVGTVTYNSPAVFDSLYLPDNGGYPRFHAGVVIDNDGNLYSTHAAIEVERDASSPDDRNHCDPCTGGV